VREDLYGCASALGHTSDCPGVRVHRCDLRAGTGTSVLTAFGIADANRHAWQTVFCNGVRWVSGRRLLSHEGTTRLLRVLACCHTRLSVPPCTICPWPSSSSVSASQSSSTPHTRCRRRHKSTMTHPSRDRLLLGPDDVLASSSVASVTMVRVIGCRFLFTLPAAVVGSLRLDKHSQQCMRVQTDKGPLAYRVANQSGLATQVVVDRVVGRHRREGTHCRCLRAVPSKSASRNQNQHRPLSAFGSSGGSQMTVSTDGKLFLVLVRVFSGIADLKWRRLPRPTTQNKCQENAYKVQETQYVGCTRATLGHTCGLRGSQKIRVNFRHRCLRRMTLPRHRHSSSHQCTVPQAP
jgi:hypothetical protein